LIDDSGSCSTPYLVVISQATLGHCKHAQNTLYSLRQRFLGGGPCSSVTPWGWPGRSSSTLTYLVRPHRHIIPPERIGLSGPSHKEAISTPVVSDFGEFRCSQVSAVSCCSLFPRFVTLLDKIFDNVPCEPRLLYLQEYYLAPFLLSS